ncbi:MAG: DNA gyrase C-terminal beta-propeller domain-containing protein, partial [Pirellulales bacterium]
RNTSGGKGISLTGDDSLVGMVVAEPDATLLTSCANGYGKRTQFGPNSASHAGDAPDDSAESNDSAEPADSAEPPEDAAAEGSEGEGVTSANRYRTQRRGGKGLRDIKTTDRNGPVIGVIGVRDDDEVLMMTARGKLQRVVAGEISIIGRNTQGVRIMTLDEGDTLAAIVRVPRDDDTPSGAATAPSGAESAEIDEPAEPEEPEASPDDE